MRRVALDDVTCATVQALAPDGTVYLFFTRIYGGGFPLCVSGTGPVGVALVSGLPQEQVSCFLTHTTGVTHKLIRDHIHLSPLYSGVIQGVSARYCPSLEDKVMRFPEKDSHQVTLEPEGRDTQEIYAKGLGNCARQLLLELDELRSVDVVLPVRTASNTPSSFATSSAASVAASTGGASNRR